MTIYLEEQTKPIKRTKRWFHNPKTNEEFILFEEDAALLSYLVKGKSTIAKQNMSKANKGRKPWNKGKTGGTRPKWPEETRLRMSENRKGSGNPSFGKSPSKETREKQSVTVKRNIVDGKFTPNVHNSRTHWRAEVKGKKFRSSWEAAFFALYDDLLFEKHRIPYFDTKANKERVYITDFTDEVNKIIYEIKPKEHHHKCFDKFTSASLWCLENGYEFILIDQMWFIEHKHLIENLEIDEAIKSKIRSIK